VAESIGLPKTNDSNILGSRLQSLSLCNVDATLNVAGLLARSQYPEGPVTGHVSTGFP
jgi:hypothetical protein